MAPSQTMSTASRILVAVATYNEIDNLPQLVESVLRVLPTAELLVIDDNSPDGTGHWCDRQAAVDRRIHCLHRPQKQGLGTATLAALQYAIDHDYDFVITMDADLSHDPSYLPDLLAGMDPPEGPPCDVMVGSRYCPGGGIRGWPQRRRLMSRAINWYSRHLLGLSVSDCSGAFRCYRISRLRSLSLSQFRSRGYAVFEELLLRLQQIGARFGELPIVFVDRARGKSKIDFREAYSALGTISGLGLQRICGLVPERERGSDG